MTVDTNSKPIVVYHGDCMDGFTAAWACWLINPDWEYQPAVHGVDPPDFTGREVYLLDFSYKRLVMGRVCEQATHVTVIDHHKTALEELKPFIGFPYTNKVEVYFDVHHSGAELAWQYFHRGEPVPRLVELVEDYDLWNFKFFETKPANAYFASFPYSFDQWDSLRAQAENKDTIKRVVTEGYSIVRYNLKMTKELLAKNTCPANIGGHDVFMANLPFMYANEGCRLLAKDPKLFGASYYVWSGGYVFSLRSLDEGMDVSAIAKMYPGGGGHAHSAGFTVPNLEALDIRKRT